MIGFDSQTVSKPEKSNKKRNKSGKSDRQNPSKNPVISGHLLTLVIKIIVLMTQKAQHLLPVLFSDQSEPQGESRQNVATSVTAF